MGMLLTCPILFLWKFGRQSRERFLRIIPKGFFNLSNQLPNVSKNLGMQRGNTGFQEFQPLILLHFSYSSSKIAIIPTIFYWKTCKISSETINLGNYENIVESEK